MSTDRRRAISVRGLTYQRLETYCDTHDLSVSGVLEVWIHEVLDATGSPRPPGLFIEPPGPSAGRRGIAHKRKGRSDTVAAAILEERRVCGAVFEF